MGKIIISVIGGVAEEVFNDSEDVDIFIFDFDGDCTFYYKEQLVEVLEINSDGTINVEFLHDGVPIDVEPSELMEHPEY